MKKKFLALGLVLTTIVGCNNNVSDSQINDSSNENNSSSSTIENSSSFEASSSSSSFESSSNEEISSSEVSDIHVESVQITNKETTTLQLGQTLQLNVLVLPENATNKLLNYESSNEDVVSVSFNGEVLARKVGAATITVYSDDGNKTDSISLQVVAAEVKSFKASFNDDVETIVSNNNTFYKLIIGKNYPLNVTFDSTNKEDEELEASFNLDGYCSFDSKTNTLKPLKKVESLALTLKVKGTNLKQEFYLKINVEGERDTSEVLVKLKTSQEKENKKNIQQYQVNLDFDTLDINENRTHSIQKTTYNIYKESTNRYMVGDTTTKIVETPYGQETSTEENYTSNIFKGMSDDGNYYEFQVFEDGYHAVTPLKKAIVESVSDSKTQITRENAVKKSTKMFMNSREGLSDIAMLHFSGLYENSIGYGSIPMYFGGSAAGVNLKIVEKNNVISADTFVIEKLPSSSSNGEAYFNHGEYTFDENGILVSIKVIAYVYDNTSFDFNTLTLKDNARYAEMYSIELTQKFGDLLSQETNKLDPSNLYFTDFTPAFADNKGYEATKFEVGQTYHISYKNQAPKYADSRIDNIIIDDSSNKEVATVINEGRSIKIEGVGSTTLTIYSTKNKVKKEVTINVGAVFPTSIITKINGSEKSVIDTFVNEKVDNISFEVLPFGTSQDIEVSVNGNGTISKNSNGTYSFVSNVEGTSTIVAKSSIDESIVASITVNVTKKTEVTSIMEVLLNNSYTCLDMNDDGYTISSNTLTFTSKTTAVLKIYDAWNEENIINCNVTIDEVSNTITFTSYDYDGEDFPLLKLNKAFNVASDGSYFEINLYYVEGNEEFDYVTGNETLQTYKFEISK